MMFKINVMQKKNDSPQAHNDFEYSFDEEEELTIPHYGENNYWDSRYQADEEVFDWYFEWSDISPLIKNYFSKDLKEGQTLVLGCGNSTMSADLFHDGFKTIESIDISPTVIEKMQMKYSDIPNLKWKVMDCSDLNYPDEHFRVIFDKGTIDAILCNISRDKIIPKMLSEIYRVLEPNGKFFIITFGPPSERLDFFRRIKLDWYLHPPLSVHYEFSSAKKSKTYIYIFEKQQKST
ncbi:Phosphoethanolamine N-methyltransferase-related protein [Tritrichomonas foetus]|uniref:Phosphoethanolamine N-methyltransferase-related protein n=1 Tax=Tritrichomonas foetus TaxID=1144522 RepID=A0A1J4K343_9EUKA|nr:Phosphoethanolamine N-methyltransferase-related protein [Tritrichomonas foetus]|eukprot:OHT05857.1 Phosphoethanolamine N-methyltransferase-related protein [Tritrichomonas foetus]